LKRNEGGRMNKFKPIRGSSLLYILLLGVLSNAFIGILLNLVESYIIILLLRTGLVGLNIYLLYYMFLNISLIYEVNADGILIKGFWGLRTIRIDFNSIEGYMLYKGNIKGVKLSGIGNDRFSFGKNVIDKVGTTHMFVTNNKNIIYIKTLQIAYAISPVDFERFEKLLANNSINDSIKEFKPKGSIDLYKEKAFYMPFILVTTLIIILTLNPLVLYLKGILPDNMPLSFDASFIPIQFGSGKQFAFKQMTYGVLNMILLLCMYYASYFCAKYDKKSAYRYIYVSLITSLVFLVLQIRILLII
jgi:hypothetical protein